MLGLVTLLVLADYSPYVRSKVSAEPEAHCLWWGGDTITFHQNVAGNPATGAKSFAAVTTAFATWQVSMTQCGGPTLEEGARVSSRKVGLEASGANINLVLFRTVSCTKKAPATSACWKDGSCANAFDCWDHASGLLGVTTISYDTATGQTTDADIELNSASNIFTAVDSPTCGERLAQSCIAVDIQNTVTHEIGHFLGLDHTKLSNSTMYATASMGDLNKRSLDQGTRAFVCEVYSERSPARDCVLTPVTEELGTAAPTKQGCSSTSLAPSVLGLLALLTRRRAKQWAVVAIALGSLAAGATTLLALSLDTMTQQSDAVVRGRVTSVEARWSADHARIITQVELSVTSTWKGAPSQRVQVLQPGGVVGSVGQRVSGTPGFTVGEEVVLFLEARGPVFVVTGLSQGKFTVEGGVATQAGTTAELIDPDTGRAIEQPPVVMPVSQLERLVRAQVPTPTTPATGLVTP